MAKVTGPLFSVSATGKVADTLVFFGWKGSSVVRQWLKPANPQSAGQGDVRIVLGGLGRACGKVVADGAFHTKLKNLGVIPSDQTKQSYLVKYIRDTYLGGSGATMTGNYIAQLALITGHTAYTSFDAGADALTLIDYDVSYASVAPFEKSLGLYLLAKAAIAIGFTGAPYSTALTSWTAGAIDKMVAHMQA